MIPRQSQFNASQRCYTLSQSADFRYISDIPCAEESRRILDRVLAWLKGRLGTAGSFKHSKHPGITCTTCHSTTGDKHGALLVRTDAGIERVISGEVRWI